MVISRAVEYPNASLETSSSDTSSSTSRDSGPHRLMTALADVRSRICTVPSSGELERIQPMSCAPNAEPVTTYQCRSPSRVIVRSHSMPPRLLHSWVYVTVPTALSISATDSHCTASSAPTPVISNLANDV